MASINVGMLEHEYAGIRQAPDAHVLPRRGARSCEVLGVRVRLVASLAVFAIFIGGCAEGMPGPHPAGPEKEPVPELPDVTDRSPEPEVVSPSPALGGRVSPGELASVVVVAGDTWSRYLPGGRGDTHRPPAAPLSRWQMLATGDIVYQQGQHDGDQPIMIVAAGETHPSVLVDRPQADSRRTTLVGAGLIEGRAVVLIEVVPSRARQTALVRGYLVAVNPGAGTSTVLVEGAADAWEGGISFAAVADHWVAHHAFDW